MVKRGFIAGFMLLGLLSISFASGEFFFSQPKSIYNYGDSFNITTTIKPGIEMSSFLEIFLSCTEEKSFHKEYLTLKANEQKIVENKLILTKNFPGMTGNCSIKAKLGNEEGKSRIFAISDKSTLSISTSNITTEAGKEIIIEGNAKKDNSNKLEGYAELNIVNNDIKILGNANNGSFTLAFSFPENTKSGDYVAIIKAYEKISNEAANEGFAKLNIKIRQTPRRIKIVSQESIMPGNNFSIQAVLLDQADDIIKNESIAVEVFDINEKSIEKSATFSNESAIIKIKTNNIPGYWKIRASYKNIEEKKLFYVQEYEKAEIEIIENEVLIKNTGNILYSEEIKLTIGDYTETKNITLDVGKEIKLKLNAPDGNYEIAVSGRDIERKTSGFLTGRAVEISESRKAANLKNILWIAVILILLIAIFFLLRRTLKKSFYEIKSKINKSMEGKKAGQKIMHLTERKIKEAEHSLALTGKKENASIIAIKADGRLNEIKEIIEKNKGSVCKSEKYILGIFSSLTTKTFSNEIIAVKAGQEISAMLNENNKKMREKTNYGIGINNGELILSKEEKIKFTAIGNAISLARKIAEIADNEFLVSKNLRNRLNNIKTEKIEKRGLVVFRVRGIVEREKHEKFIQNFLNRNTENS